MIGFVGEIKRTVVKDGVEIDNRENGSIVGKSPTFHCPTRRSTDKIDNTVVSFSRVQGVTKKVFLTIVKGRRLI